MQIDVECYDDPNQIIFLPHCMLAEEGSLPFTTHEQAKKLPLAAALFDVAGVVSVTIGSDYIKVTKQEGRPFEEVSKACLSVINDCLTPLVEESCNRENHGGVSVY